MHKESGNVLFLILIAVMLFAALTYAATQSTRLAGNMDADREKTDINSAEMTQYMAFMESMISRLTAVGGCSVTTLSFERPPFDGSDVNYVNPNSPVNFSCHVFHPLGGTVSSRTMEGHSFDFSGARYIQDIGTSIGNPADIADLYAMIEVSRSTCIRLNKNFDVDNPSGEPPVLDGFGDDVLYTGTFDGTNSVNVSATETYGKHDFCGSVAGVYKYIHVLYAR